MTIKELHEITPPKTIIFVGAGGNCRELDRADPVELAIYGKYVIGKITAASENEIDAEIKLILATEE